MFFSLSLSRIEFSSCPFSLSKRVSKGEAPREKTETERAFARPSLSLSLSPFVPVRVVDVRRQLHKAMDPRMLQQMGGAGNLMQMMKEMSKLEAEGGGKGGGLF